MPDQAPRIHPALLAALARIDRKRTPIAETHRRLGRLAERLGMTRPSYEQVRVLVHEHRRRGLEPSAGRILLDVALMRRSESEIALLRHRGL